MTSCDNTIIWKYSAKQHLLRVHNMYEEEEERTWRNDTYSLWQHFSREENFWARCEFCDRPIFAYKRHYLMSHLKKCNKNALAKIREDIVCSWLSQYFEFTDRDAYCKICKSPSEYYCVRIFEGRDVLESHVKHHYEGGVIEQSVYETNYAGPNFCHDNTHPQSLGNPEDQQRSNVGIVGNNGQSSSGQQESKIYNSLFEFINDLPDEILMQYQEKQQR
ncbi:hypothetical protein DBV15_05124 [Temnothorax longispinosus]|uniref:BED-type domain-containing protein n=1 Tax=Temnothorax longispinosus TaxID=300112 RepID=A0A4S2KUC7_9HYME|nr:hypothetical protein DBV15_05124 [Temnothorax longispinosus]